MGFCNECGKVAYGGRVGSWLISDQLWAAAGYSPTDVACKACTSRRIRKEFGLMERGFMNLVGAAHAQIVAQTAR
jgi:hypothetical protein